MNDALRMNRDWLREISDEDRVNWLTDPPGSGSRWWFAYD
jgi:hypothetical protein